MILLRRLLPILVVVSLVAPLAAQPSKPLGSYFMVFNTILNFDSLDAGRKLDAR